MAIVPITRYGGLHTISPDESVSYVRSFCKEHHLNVKLSGKGRNKQSIVYDINNEVNYWLEFIDKIIIQERNIIMQQSKHEKSNHSTIAYTLITLLAISMLISIVLFGNNENNCQSFCKLFQWSGSDSVNKPSITKIEPIYNGTLPGIGIENNDDNDDKNSSKPSKPAKNGTSIIKIGTNNKMGSITIKEIPREIGSTGVGGWHIPYDYYNRNKSILVYCLNEIARVKSRGMISVLQGYFEFHDLSEQDVEEWKLSLRNDIYNKFEDMLDADIYAPNPYQDMEFYHKKSTFSMDVEPKLLEFIFEIEVELTCIETEPDTFFVRDAFRAFSSVDPLLEALVEKQLQYDSAAEDARSLP